MTDCADLFRLLPQNEAMSTLLAAKPGPAEALDFVETANASPSLKAALWLYVDNLERAHVIVQALPDSTGSYLHAILHRREGDFANSKYWFRRAGPHPAPGTIPGFDPILFVDLAAAAGASNPAALVTTQRQEWRAVFDHLNGSGA